MSDEVAKQRTNIMNYDTNENIYRATTPTTNNRKVVTTTAITLTGGTGTVATTTTTDTDVVVAMTSSNHDDDDDFGWGTDDDLDLDLDLDDNNDVDDDDDVIRNCGNEKASSELQRHVNSISITNNVTTTINNNSNNNPFVQEVHEYIISIPQRIKVLESILHNYYNTKVKAIEIQQYYIQRPQLLQYTIDKEVSRMDYTIITTTIKNKNGLPMEERIVIQNKDEIRSILSSLELSSSNNNNDNNSNNSSSAASTATTAASAQLLLGRCSNQSILVDVLQAMSTTSSTNNNTNSNNMLLLPSKLMCTAIANKCHYTIDLIHNTLNVNVQFHISLPLLNTRWNIGQLHVSILYDCNHIMIQYQIIKYESYVSSNINDEQHLSSIYFDCNNNENEYITNLHQCASVLQELSVEIDDGSHDVLLSSTSSPTTTTTKNTLDRDALVQQILYTSIAKDVVIDGMKSAWQDFDAATGLVSKIKYLPSLLPSVDDDIGISEEENDHHYNNNTGSHYNQSKTIIPHPQNAVAPSHHKQYTGQQQQQQLQASENKSNQSQRRPTSILGGFVRSLAQSVTLPQEDPTIYQNWYVDEKYSQQQKSVSSDVSGTRYNNSGTSLPKLYNNETPKNGNETGSSGEDERRDTLRLYNSDESFPSKSNSQHLNLNPHIVNQQNQTGSNSNHSSAPLDGFALKTIPSINTFYASDTPIKGNSMVKQENISNDGWDDVDDIDIEIDDREDTCNDEFENALSSFTIPLTSNDHSTNIESLKDSWVYDHITDFIPTCTRYRNPIGGSRVLNDMKQTIHTHSGKM